MPTLRPLPLLAVLLAGFPAVSMAQDADQPDVPAQTAPADTAPADPMPVSADCDAAFIALDLNDDGFLSAAEAPRDHARAAIDNIPVTEEGIARENWLTLCSSPYWQSNQPEEGAPFEGANSFTEEQARDRATAWQIADIGALTLDGGGIWRGTGTLDGTPVTFAIDYRGNVVITP